MYSRDRKDSISFLMHSQPGMKASDDEDVKAFALDSATCNRFCNSRASTILESTPSAYVRTYTPVAQCLSIIALLLGQVWVETSVHTSNWNRPIRSGYKSIIPCGTLLPTWISECKERSGLRSIAPCISTPAVYFSLLDSVRKGGYILCLGVVFALTSRYIVNMNGIGNVKPNILEE